jgi:hypothetical protein
MVFILGTLLGSSITAMFNYFSVNRKYRREYLEKQLKEIYVPLYLLTQKFKGNGERINSLSQYKDENGSGLQDKLAYIEQKQDWIVLDILPIVEKNISLVDNKDLPFFIEACQKIGHYKTEYHDKITSGDRKTYNADALGKLAKEINSYITNLDNNLKNKCEKKQEEIDKLQKTFKETLCSFIHKWLSWKTYKELLYSLQNLCQDSK